MNKRKLGFILGGLVILAAVGVVITKTHLESKMRESIRRELASLPESFRISVGDIQVSWLDGSITITNIKGECEVPAGEFFKWSVDKYEAKGVSPEVFSHDNKSTGVVRIAEQATLTGVNSEGARQKVSVGAVRFGEITGDVGRLRNDVFNFMQHWGLLANPKLLHEPSNRQKVLKSLAAVFSSLETMRVSDMTYMDYTASTELENTTIRVKFASMQTKRYSLREVEAVSFSPLSVTVDDQPTCVIGSLGWDDLKIPSFVGLFDLLADTGDPTWEQIKSVFQGQVFNLNMRLKNIVANVPGDAKNPLFTLADTSLRYGADVIHSVKFGYSGLIVDKNRVQSALELSNDATALLPQQLDFSGDFESQFDNKNPALIDVDCKNLSLKEAGLGSVSLRFAVDKLNVKGLVSGSSGQGELKNFAANLVDAGASDVIFTVFADETNTRRKALQSQGSGAMQPPLTAANSRVMAVAALAMRRDSLPNRALKELIDAGITFLSKPGSSLTLTVAPPKPVNMMELLSVVLTAPERLGLKFAVDTPATKQ